MKSQTIPNRSHRFGTDGYGRYFFGGDEVFFVRAVNNYAIFRRPIPRKSQDQLIFTETTEHVRPGKSMSFTPIFIINASYKNRSLDMEILSMLELTP